MDYSYHIFLSTWYHFCICDTCYTWMNIFILVFFPLDVFHVLSVLFFFFICLMHYASILFLRPSLPSFHPLSLFFFFHCPPFLLFPCSLSLPSLIPMGHSCTRLLTHSSLQGPLVHHWLSICYGFLSRMSGQNVNTHRLWWYLDEWFPLLQVMDHKWVFVGHQHCRWAIVFA